MREREIFIGALLKESPDERAAYLEAACAGDAKLHNRLVQLIRCHESPESSLLDSPALTSLASPAQAPILHELSGMQIGPYTLKQPLGEGGMGVVYSAVQTTPVWRTVAIKVLKPGMDTCQFISRFEAERQSLAMMDHPNIARVFDVGATGYGRPYFVMELVDGLPITQFCETHRLTAVERLRLFVSVCRGVQHAHQKGVIHRDLKPTNILVTHCDGQPIPKIIDFGIAKITNCALNAPRGVTRVGQIVGTPEYMSPEQAGLNHWDVDTRSDIYSLGVVLYELLTGAIPLDGERLRSAALDEKLRIVREERPVPPSQKIVHEKLAALTDQGHAVSRRLINAFRSELDWIVLKSLARERSQRYQTASSLADDLLRYLNNEPVEARPPSWRYLLRKSASKHRVAFTATATVALALVMGLVGVSTQLSRALRAERVAVLEREAAASARDRALAAQQRADTNLNHARSAVSRLASLSLQLRDVPGTERFRRELLTIALGYYAQFVDTNRPIPQLGHDLAVAHYKIGQFEMELGNYGPAIAALQEGLTLLTTSDADGNSSANRIANSGDQVSAGLASTLRLKADIFFALGTVQLALGELDQAQNGFSEAIENRQVLVLRCGTSDDQIYLAQDYHNLSIVLLRRGELDEAKRVADRSMALTLDLIARDPQRYEYRTRYARIVGYSAALLARSQRWDESRPLAEQVLRMHEELTAENPRDRDCQRRLAVSADWMAQVSEHDRQWEQALAYSLRSVAIGEALVEDFPQSVRFREELAEHRVTLARIRDAMAARAATSSEVALADVQTAANAALERPASPVPKRPGQAVGRH